MNYYTYYAALYYDMMCDNIPRSAGTPSGARRPTSVAGARRSTRRRSRFLKGGRSGNRV